MTLQQGNVLSVYDELNHRITFQSLKQYLVRHGWKLCFYGKPAPNHICNASQAESDSVGEQILRIAGIEEYARNVSSFAYRSNENRAVFINREKHPSPRKLLRLMAHEIGHIHNRHEPVDCILGKGDYYLEREANSFMRHMMQLRRRQYLRDILAFHKTKLLLSLVAILLFGCYSGVQYARFSTFSAPAPSAAPADTAVFSPAAVEIEETAAVYVAKSGRVFHLYADCYHIKGHDGVTTLTYGEITDKPLCSHCKKRYLQILTP